MTRSAGKRYDMPATFGPSAVPARTICEHAQSLVLTFETTAESVRSFVPEHFGLPDRPSVSISHVSYRDVDYLGGRGYNEIVVSISAIRETADERIETGYAAVLWVDQIGALISGREYMGLAKLLGTIPDLIVEGQEARFACFEYDALLLSGSACGLAPVPSDRLAKINARAGNVRTLGWKYIAGPGGTTHLDVPMLNVMRWDYQAAWTGNGKITFETPDRRDAPMSSQVVRSLQNIPVLGEAKVFFGKGRATIDRDATRCV